MAPINQNFKAKSQIIGKQFQDNYTKGHPSGVNKKKRKWIPANKYFVGSAQEGHGFAVKRKQKVQQQYNKLVKKERWRKKDSRPQVTEEEYPEHLKHLYIAEQQRLDEEEQTKRNRRRKAKTADGGVEEQGEPHSSSVSAVSSDDRPQSSQTESTLKQSKQKKLSSYQKTIQEYDRIKMERERKREEYLKNKAQREEALKKYKEKKMATYQLLKKKTKKGQPNLNLQMELLLQKIQAQKK